MSEPSPLSSGPSSRPEGAPPSALLATPARAGTPDHSGIRTTAASRSPDAAERLPRSRWPTKS